MRKNQSRYVLGLDLALSCGWCCILDGKIIDCGVHDFHHVRDAMGKHNGHVFDALFQWIISYASPNVQLAYELAHHRGGATTRLACGWQATVQLVAAHYKMPPPISVATISLKKWACGSGRADKADMIAWAAEKLGRYPIDDNEADAVAVALWAVETLGKSKGVPE